MRLQTAEGDRDLRSERTGRNGRGHRVAGVVEAIREVERECGHDDDHQDHEFSH